MNDSGVVVTIVGARGLVGRELVEVLDERQFSVAECRRVDRVNALDPDETDWDDAISDVEAADFEGVDLVFMCASADVTRALTPAATRAGARVIDLTQAYADDASVPVIVPEVNIHVLSERPDLDVVASPAPGAVALAVVLKPLEEAATLQRVVVAGYESVSVAGSAGIEELSRQTADLLNGRSVEAAIFPQRIAFNVIPQVGAALADGVAGGDRLVERQTRQILDLPELPIVVTSVIVPAFFGTGFVANVQTASPLSAAEAVEVLRQSPGILLVDQPQTNTFPTFADCVGQEATFVGRVRDDGSVAHGVSLWIALDSIRKGAAVNAVQIAERLIRHPG
jgi:aspartate-semialdehyde dehydrogenase